MSNENTDKDVVLNHPEYQRMLKHIKDHRDDPDFPHMATEKGQRRVLVLEVTDPDLAGAALPIAMYRKDTLDILPGLEWQSLGVVGNGGWLSTGTVAVWLNDTGNSIQGNEIDFIDSINTIYMDLTDSRKMDMAAGIKMFLDHNFEELSMYRSHPLNNLNSEEVDSHNQQTLTRHHLHPADIADWVQEERAKVNGTHGDPEDQGRDAFNDRLKHQPVSDEQLQWMKQGALAMLDEVEALSGLKESPRKDGDKREI